MAKSQLQLVRAHEGATLRNYWNTAPTALQLVRVYEVATATQYVGVACGRVEDEEYGYAVMTPADDLPICRSANPVSIPGRRYSPLW